jgi:hypothetical protein
MSSPHPPSAALDAPVVFTGRGGSGTRLLSQLADTLGVFIGNRVNRSGDSIEWVPLIYRMAVETAVSADLPAGSRYRTEIRTLAADVLQASPMRPPQAWGLKLPEAMLVLPLLIDAFPQAKVVHLTRHPVPASLRRTHMTSRMDNAVGAATLPNAYRDANRDARSIATDEPYVHNACSWRYQVSRVVRYGRAALGAGRYLESRYEDVCTDTAASIERLRAFLGITGERHAGSVAIDASRMGGWDSSDPRARTVWEICGETAALLGYGLEPGEAGPVRSAQQGE